jgi:hypothetical protein
MFIVLMVSLLQSNILNEVKKPNLSVIQKRVNIFWGIEAGTGVRRYLILNCVVDPLLSDKPIYNI